MGRERLGNPIGDYVSPRRDSTSWHNTEIWNIAWKVDETTKSIQTKNQWKSTYDDTLVNLKIKNDASMIEFINA